MRNDNRKGLGCIIAGGGTGGHLFPGIAIARELRERCEDASVLFVVGHRRMESEILQKHGFQVAFIHVEGMKGRGWKKGVAVLAMLPGSILQSIRIIRDFRPAVVIGVGGYSSGPFCLAARLMGVPTAIHEQNSYPGLTNRLLSPLVDQIFISFEESAPHFKGGKTVLTGNPVRRELTSPPPASAPSSSPFTVLVVGGSQGAKAINDIFVEAYDVLRKEGKAPDVIHQTGKQDHQKVLESYRTKVPDALASRANVLPFIEDMASAYQRADLVVGRAGATTLFELAALGKPSILIPYPYATNGHQETNARSLAQTGGAEMILQEDLSIRGLADRLAYHMDHPQQLKAMGDAAKKFSRPDADRIIVDHIFKLIGGAQE